MNNKKLKVSVIGGLGLMASPMAVHWKDSSNIEVLYVHDRGKKDKRRDHCRSRWNEYGASLFSSIEDCLSADIDGVIICCGKNADDIKVISEVVSKLKGTKKFICHMSTVSTRFVQAATEYCSINNVEYVNYPLTGGPAGAEKGKMLILSGGNRDLYNLLEPALSEIGCPKYFGEGITAGTEVKLIGHLMVFNGLNGICSAISLHSECFENGALGSKEQGDFFDYLNSGAGGTKQWDLITHQGIKNDIWHEPFLIKYAVVDAIYLLELCIEKRLPLMTVQSVINIVLAFSYVANYVDEELATHSIVREMLVAKNDKLDKFMLENSSEVADYKCGLELAIESLPLKIRKSVGINISAKDFQMIEV